MNGVLEGSILGQKVPQLAMCFFQS